MLSSSTSAFGGFQARERVQRLDSSRPKGSTQLDIISELPTYRFLWFVLLLLLFVFVHAGSVVLDLLGVVVALLGQSVKWEERLDSIRGFNLEIWRRKFKGGSSVRIKILNSFFAEHPMIAFFEFLRISSRSLGRPGLLDLLVWRFYRIFFERYNENSN